MQRVHQPHWLLNWVVPILVFLLAFLPRAIYSVSRPLQWYERAVRFWDAFLAADWAGTYQSYHPGVTTMWLSGVGLKLFAWQRGLSSEQLLSIEPTKPGTVSAAIEAGVIPLVFVIALCIAGSYSLLSRIVDWKMALVGSCLLALDPFHITYSKVLHVNATLATFMFLSALLVLSYLRHHRWRDLILGGVFAGLAFLTKSPSVFLVPYTSLLVFVHELVKPGLAPGAQSGRGAWARRLWVVLRALLVWGGAAALTFFALWPAMWVMPVEVLSRIGARIVFHVETAHENPILFNGWVGYGDPGLSFYLATILWKLTGVTLVLIVVALVFALARRGKGRYASTTLWMIVYVVCFTAQMSLAEWKQVSYMVPVFPALATLAGLGLVQAAKAIGHLRVWRGWRGVAVLITIPALALQAGLVLRHHPYYGTHHNALLGGSRVAQRVLPLQDQGEGLDLVAEYLNALPRAQRARAIIYSLGAEMFERHFLGFTNTVRDPWINYRVYYVNQLRRGLGGEAWREMWEADRRTDPLWTVAFDGVTYVWVYGAPPGEAAAGGPEYAVDYRLGEHITLSRVRLSAETLTPGDTLTVVLIWTSDGQVREDFTVFCHLLSASGALVAQRDGPPIYGVRPTPTWRAGEVIEDSYDLLLGDEFMPGEYELSVGMYNAESGLRVPAYGGDGKRLLDDRVILGTIRVEAPGTSGE